VGVLIKGLYNPFFAQMIQTIEKHLANSGYTAIIHYNTDTTKDIDAAYEFAMEKKLRGIICLGGDFDLAEDDDISRLDIPIVLTSTEIPSLLNKEYFSSVIIDNENAAYKAVEYLYDLGHRKIGLLTTGGDDKSVGTYRTKGYLKLLSDKNIEKKDHYFELGAYTFDTGYEAMKRLLEKTDDLTALFVISDLMAIGAAKAIHEAGLRIPEDISIIGFDDIDYAAYFNPSLTTIRQPVEEIAMKSVDILVGVIDHQLEHQHVVFETELIERSSCRRMD
jgi:LacI family transcriptional regulator